MTGYMIGPEVTMQLVDDEAVILTSDPGSGAFPSAACCRSSAMQYTAVRCPALRPSQLFLGPMGRKRFMRRY
jgi:hypothetical protein